MEQEQTQQEEGDYITPENSFSIGGIVLASNTHDMPDLIELAKRVIKDKTFSKFLEFKKKQDAVSGASYTG